MVRALAAHQCGPGSILEPGVIGLSLTCCWFSPFSEGFSPGSPVFLPEQEPTLPNTIGEFQEPPVFQWQITFIIFFTHFILKNPETRPSCVAQVTAQGQNKEPLVQTGV